MSFVHICLKCKAVFKYPTQDVHTCPDCSISMFSTGFSDAEWARLSPQQRNEYKEAETRKRLEEQRRLEEEQRRLAQEKEERKTAYIKSRSDYIFYEYDVDVIPNDGGVNVELLKSVLDARARKGWKLHSIYSNELGENSHVEAAGWNRTVRINSTASQDVLIFERRIMDDSQR